MFTDVLKGPLGLKQICHAAKEIKYTFDNY